MKRRVFSVGQHIKPIRAKIIGVIQPPEEEGYEKIRYLVQCDQCGDQRTLAHSTLRQRCSDRRFTCGTCNSKSSDYNVVPPTWPVPPMVLEERGKVE